MCLNGCTFLSFDARIGRACMLCYVWMIEVEVEWRQRSGIRKTVDSRGEWLTRLKVFRGDILYWWFSGNRFASNWGRNNINPIRVA